MLSRTVRAERAAFTGVWTLLFAASTAVTIAWCTSMSGAHDMPMPGGWTMSMAWMRMPGQSWAEAAASFVGMWSVMMVAMMAQLSRRHCGGIAQLCKETVVPES